MTKFQETFEQQCLEHDVTWERAIMDATDMPPKVFLDAMHHGWIPEESVIHAIADYFCVSIEEFKEKSYKNNMYDTLMQLCTVQKQGLVDVIKNVCKVDSEAAALLLNRIRDGRLRDEQTLKQIADYFGVGLSDLTGERYHLTYLVGPITGHSTFREEFEAAEDYLTKKGYHVISPVKITAALPKTYMRRENFMEIGITMLSFCDTIAVIPGWESHSGCQMEVSIAKATGKEILWLSTKDIQKRRSKAKEEKPVKQVIIINGRGGAGKDTMCNFAAKKYRIRNSSAITPIKEIAERCGWAGRKDDRSRKFLADLKQAFVAFNDLPTQHLKAEYERFCQDPREEIMFAHIRESSEIEKFKDIVANAGGVCKTLLIDRPESVTWGNTADDNVNDYAYDYIYTNDKPLAKAEGDFLNFLDGIIRR